RRLARRPIGGAARGSRPGAELDVPRPLPRRRGRSLPGLLHRHGEHGRDDPRPAARPHGGDPLRRVHQRRAGRDRARLPLAAPAGARTRARCLWPRQRERAGLTEDEVSIADGVLETVISEYTREAGVRQLERELGSILRKTATKIVTKEAEPPVELDVDAVRDALGRQKFFREAAERTAVPGVATGLAVNATGGDVLFVEATAVPGEGLVLTGQRVDIMKESAQIALLSVRSQAEQLG